MTLKVWYPEGYVHKKKPRGISPGLLKFLGGLLFVAGLFIYAYVSSGSHWHTLLWPDEQPLSVTCISCPGTPIYSRP